MFSDPKILRVFVPSWLVVVALLAVTVSAVTRLPSADGQFWDIQDTSPWAQDSGGIATGGGANPFNGFGYLKLHVQRPDGATLVQNQYLHGFGLAHDGAERFDSITPIVTAASSIDRAIFAPKDTNYLRYVDSYTNVDDAPRVVSVAWGGAAGAYDDGGRLTVATTSNGDRRIDRADTLRHGDAERARRRRSDARTVGPRPVGPRARDERGRRLHHCRVGDMYGDPFAERLARLRPGARRLRVHVHREPGTDRRADDVRREGPERGLRSARRIPGSASRCAGGAEAHGAVRAGPASRFRRQDRRSRASPTWRGSSSARPTCAD